ncbi:MAG: N-acetylmuramoyl-L-alanine amidase [Desulfitobacteriaceae bacterium]
MRRQHVKQFIFGILFLAFGLVFSTQAQAAPLNCQTNRLYGATRIDTAIRVSQIGWQHAGTVLLARADDFPDSLVAVPLSHRLDAPILLTYPDQLDPMVLSEMKRLGTQHVILLGGEGVLGGVISTPLEKAGLTWERIGGVDRYDTAVRIAQRLGPNGQAVLVNGENFPDALAIAPYAGVTETPILLTNVQELPAIIRKEILALEPGTVVNGGESVGQTIVVGGDGVIPSATLQGVPAINRIAGKDRYETAAKVYWFSENVLTGLAGAAPPLNPGTTGTNKVQSTTPIATANKAYLVTGENFPDALVAGALAARQAAPLFMSSTNSLPAMTYSAMGNAAENGLQVTIVGGGAVLSTVVQKTVEGTIQPPYLLGGLTVAVDPGHGGKDTGAIGATGTYEKNNTLPVALALADLLRTAGAQVILTRTTDAAPTGSKYAELPDLETRVGLANTGKADLFVSIHNDSFSNPAAGGTTTYYSSDNPKQDKAQQLGQNIQDQVVKQLGLQDRGVKDANFYVIKYTNMPAVLVELGFISNPNEEKILSSLDGQKKAALGIYRGLLVFRGY